MMTTAFVGCVRKPVRYRHAWPGFVLLGSLSVFLASLLAWGGEHFLSPGPAGGIRRRRKP
jgi:hypothetical protein